MSRARAIIQIIRKIDLDTGIPAFFTGARRARPPILCTMLMFPVCIVMIICYECSTPFFTKRSRSAPMGAKRLTDNAGMDRLVLSPTRKKFTGHGESCCLTGKIV
jgi:hypothetical protein